MGYILTFFKYVKKCSSVKEKQCFNVEKKCKCNIISIKRTKIHSNKCY